MLSRIWKRRKSDSEKIRQRVCQEKIKYRHRLTQINTDEKIDAVKNSSPNPPKEKISVNPCKSVS
jgi:hypothetical protein